MKFWKYFNAKKDFYIRQYDLKPFYLDYFSENWRKFLTLLIKNSNIDPCTKNMTHLNWKLLLIKSSEKYFAKMKVHQNKDARSERISNHCSHLLKVLLESPLNLPARCIVFVWPRCKVVLEKCVCFKGNSHNALQN